MTAAKKREVFHSVLGAEGWQVTKDGKAVSEHASQADAEAAAIQAGRKAFEKGGLGQAVLHKSDGVISEERTYGEDPEKTPG